VQKDRTPAQVERAQAIATHTPMRMGTLLFGADFNPDNLPRTNSLLSDIYNERYAIIMEAKLKWNRARPYNRGLGVEPCVPHANGTSYPSGHSAAAAVLATLWGEILPAHRAFFQNQVRETMWARVMGGAHYPTDTQAGRLLGNLIAREMLKTPATRDALNEIRAEVKAFLQTHPDAAARAGKPAL
jgi:acid phosphatase (class A)